jgi:queuine tRNA-ribosyltransferase
MFEFKISRKDPKTAARTASFYTPHGKIRTPVFMPVGTYGAVKTLIPEEVRACGSEIILGNTFHLHLRPGEDLIKKFGGLHKFMNWDGPILTDSGGFQVFSLAKMRQISDSGVDFRSPLDGSKIRLTPKKALQIKQKL